MSNARFGSENAIGQFNQSEQGDKEPCRHWDWRENEYDGAAWVENAKGKQHTKNPTESALAEKNECPTSVLN